MATVLDRWSRASLAPGKRQVSRAWCVGALSCWNYNKLALGYPAYVWRYLLGKKVVVIVGLCPIHFDIRLDVMDFSAAKLRDAVIWKIGTSVFNKVVRWYESGEVENLYIAWNFSHFSIYLPKVIKIGGNLTKFWQKQFCTFFIETRCIFHMWAKSTLIQFIQTICI